MLAEEFSAMHQTLLEHPHLLEALDGALNAYDGLTQEHAERAQVLATLIGAQLGVVGEELEALPWAALLHDLGKLAVGWATLNKPGPFTSEERHLMERHPIVGSAVLMALSPRLAPIADGVRSHHEWWDGTGYPEGLKGELIPLTGRIVAVADVYDAMTSHRSYQKARFTRREALTHIQVGSGSHFDPAVVEALESVLGHTQPN